MTKITVGFFHYIIPGLKFKKLYQEFPFSIKRRNSIINYVLSKGLNVQVLQYKDDTIIFIDNKNFKQR